MSDEPKVAANTMGSGAAAAKAGYGEPYPDSPAPADPDPDKVAVQTVEMGACRDDLKSITDLVTVLGERIARLSQRLGL